MYDRTEPNLPKWPFFLGDLLLLGAAWFIYSQSVRPVGPWQIGLIVLCAAGGAALTVIPFLLEYRVLVKVAEARGLTTLATQMQNLEGVAAQITDATARWQSVQEQAGKTSSAAKAIAERMGAEVKAFTEFMQQVNSSEKATLRLEVEKLRRAESEWLQVLVRMLDHVYALHTGALRSGQPNLIEQVGNFQNACREVIRRVGLTPFSAAPAEPFDPQRHQILEGNGAAPEGGSVAETVATGYTFQGRLLRPALVRLRNGEPQGLSQQEEQPATEKGTQSDLPLESSAVVPASQP
jgi:molecular chaperone GrpE (heat shock protein)